MDWDGIRRLVGEAAAAGDPVAARIKGLKLETNSFVLLLHDPYEGGGVMMMMMMPITTTTTRKLETSSYVFLNRKTGERIGMFFLDCEY